MDKIKAQQTTETAEQFTKRLRNMGYRCIGTGAFAAVYARPGDDVVIKVGREGEADPWVHYAHAVRSSKRNPWLPEVNKVALFHCSTVTQCDHSARYYVAEIERLKPINTGRNRDHRDILSGLESVWDIVNDVSERALAAFGLNRDLTAAFSLISKVQRQTRSSRDIHSGNVMLRGEQFVITDPLCG